MKILLVGAGQIGSRHLQGMAMLNQIAKTAAEIFVLDPSTSSLKVAEERFQAMKSGQELPPVHFESDIAKLKNVGPFDVAIVATDARIRRSATENIFAHLQIKNLILEKILFQKKSDYAEIQKLLTSKQVRTWVNCPMRIWPGYKTLKDHMAKDRATKTPIKMTLTGGGWGLACNSIHYMDLFCFLSDSTVKTVSTQNLDPEVIPSKRAGFYELTGELNVDFSDGSQFSIVCEKNSTKPIQMTIEMDTQRHVIREDLKACWSSFANQHWQIEKWDLQMPYQSQVTGLVVVDILEKKQTLLPTYEESMKTHLIMLDSFLTFFDARMKTVDNGESVCPIT